MGTVLEIICTCPDECPEEIWAFASLSLHKYLDLGDLSWVTSLPGLASLSYTLYFGTESLRGTSAVGFTSSFGSSVRTGGEPEVSLLDTEAEEYTNLHLRSHLTMLPAGDGWADTSRSSVKASSEVPWWLMVFRRCDVEHSCVPSKHLGHCLYVLPVSFKVTLGQPPSGCEPTTLGTDWWGLIQIRSHRATGLFLLLQSVSRESQWDQEGERGRRKANMNLLDHLKSPGFAPRRENSRWLGSLRSYNVDPSFLGSSGSLS